MSSVPFKIAYLHIPRTGGETLKRIFSQHYAKTAVRSINNERACKVFCKLSYEDKLRYDMLYGHFRFGFDPNLPRRFMHMTQLREPVDRVISAYAYLMAGKSSIDFQEDMRKEKWSILDFARSKVAIPHVYPSLCHYTKPTSASADLKTLVHEALRILESHFMFVNLLEQFDEGLVYLNEVFGFEVNYSEAFVLPEKDRVTVTEEERYQLARILAPETAVYRVQQERFAKQMSAISDLDAKVAAFREQNELWRKKQKE